MAPRPPALRRNPRPAPFWLHDFGNARYEWRRVAAEAIGTFFLVLAGAGPAVVAARYPGALPAPDQAAVPGLMVMALILATGAVSGAHLNPVVSVAFSLRGEFPWRRVPAYVAAQLAGGVLAALTIRALIGGAGALGATLPGRGVDDVAAMGMEALLTCGLVTVILGTASGAQNVGPLSAIAVGGYIALAGVGFGAVTGASMNPVRSLGPDLVRSGYGHVWPYLAGPAIGMLAAVAFAIVLRGRGHDPTASRAAQGILEEDRLAPGGAGAPGGQGRGVEPARRA